MRGLIGQAVGWVMYRLRLRAPKACATLEFELPLRPAAGVYTEVNPKPGLIPNVVYQTWVSPRFGRTHVKELKRFRARNSDCSFRFFSDDDIERYMELTYGQHPVFEVFRNARFGPLKTDIWRYCILFERGGIYCDIGKAIGIPFSELIPRDAKAVISWERRGTSPLIASPEAARRLRYPDKVMINWALMFAPGHPLLKRAIDGIVEKYPKLKGKAAEVPKLEILKFTGPLHLTECLLAAAEAGELADAWQADIEFQQSTDWGIPGAWVRYINRPPYELARGLPII